MLYHHHFEIIELIRCHQAYHIIIRLIKLQKVKKLIHIFGYAYKRYSKHRKLKTA